MIDWQRAATASSSNISSLGSGKKRTPQKEDMLQVGDASSALRPLRWKSSMEANMDRPKLLGESTAREDRHRLIQEPHVAPLTQFVERLRQANPNLPRNYIPYFDPWDGGIQAE